MQRFTIDKRAAWFQKYICDRDRANFHKMVVGVMKMYFPKMNPQVIRYRKYKGFPKEPFTDSLRHELYIEERFLNKKELDAFSTICIRVSDKHAPKKSDIYDLAIKLSLK